MFAKQKDAYYNKGGGIAVIVYDGSNDKKVSSTNHTVMVISVGECGNLDMITLRKNGRKDWSLFYCEQGTMTFEKTTVHPGQVWIYPPDVPQTYLLRQSDNTTYHYLHFTGNAVHEVIDSLGIPTLAPLDAPKDVFFEIFKKIKKSSVGDDGLSRVKTEYYTLRLLSLLSEESPRISKKNMMLRVTEDMSHTYPMPYDASKYAKMFSVSVGRFNHLFKEITGSSPLNYYIRTRMENACLLIECTELTIAEIAQRVGYENPVYFSQAFKRQIGISPSVYRRIHHK